MARDRRRKRYSVRAYVEDLVEQGLKYYEALKSVLGQQQRGEAEIEVIFVLGEAPRTGELGA